MSSPWVFSRLHKTIGPALIVTAMVCPPIQALAHHDGGTQLPVSLNVSGTTGGLSRLGAAPETRFGLNTRAFRVSGHPLYGAFRGGDATVLVNAMSAALGIAHQTAIEAIVPIITDLPTQANGGNTGIGDIQFGIRWFALTQRNDATFSVALESSLPTGDANLGFGADAVVSRTSARLSRGFDGGSLRVFADAGIAWAWADRRGGMADVAVATLWQATRVVGVFAEARFLTALERGRQQALNFGGLTRQAGDTSVVLTPAITCLLGERVTAALGPQLPLGFQDFDIAVALSVTYRQ